MFAPPTTKTQTKSTTSATTGRPSRPDVGIQETLTRSAERARNSAKERVNDRGVELGGRSCDFSQIPVFPRGRIQAKLKIGAVDDSLEHEADRIADQVMRMLKGTVSLSAAPLQLARKCTTCAEEEELQRKLAGTSEVIAREVPSQVHEALREPGHPLDGSSRAYFEPRFGHDFSGVRVHSSMTANKSAQAINARAYTVGHDVVFGAGEFAPESQEGRRLIAHELTHVLQQSESQSLHGEFARQRYISRAPGSLLSRKTPSPDEGKQKNETAKRKTVEQHVKQLHKVSDYLDSARKLQPDPKKNLRDSDSLFHNTVELLDHGKLTLTVLSPTHYSANLHFDTRVKFDSRGGFPTPAPDYSADPKTPSAGLVFDDKSSFGMVKSDVPDAPQPLSEKIEQEPARVDYRTGKSEPAATKSGPPPAKPSSQAPVATSPFLPGDVRLFTRGLDMTEDNFRNTFVHEGQHVADLTPRLQSAHNANDLLETYKSEFRAFWIQPPPRPPGGGIGQPAIDRLPEPKGKADNSREVIIFQPEHCKLCSAPAPSAKAGKGADAVAKTGMKNPRQEAIFWHIISHYQDQQYDCCYVYDKHFHDQVNEFAFPEGVNLINSDRLMNLNLEVRNLNKSLTLTQVSNTKFAEVVARLEPLDWVFLNDGSSKPFWETLTSSAPGFVYKGMKALVREGMKNPVSAADVSQALSRK
jgi:Domain of unknown function (DUF4157)